MAKIELDEQLNIIFEEIEKALEVAGSRSNMRTLAIQTRDQIKKRTRLGKGVSNSQSFKNLKELKPKYIKKRTKHASRLHQDTSPSTSNLTATGQLLNSIDFKYRKQFFELFFKPQRRGELDGRRSKINNKVLAEFVEEAGRPFFRLSKTEEAELERTIRRLYLKELDKIK